MTRAADKLKKHIDNIKLRLRCLEELETHIVLDYSSCDPFKYEYRTQGSDYCRITDIKFNKYGISVGYQATFSYDIPMYLIADFIKKYHEETT